MTTTRHSRVPLVIATATVGLLLGACGGDPAPAPAGGPVQVPAASEVQASTPAAAAPAPTVSPAPAAPPAAAAGAPTLLPAVDDPIADLEVEDQRGDGTSVLVEEAELSVPGHVAIYDGNGELIGSTPIEPGETTDFPVQLATPVGQGRNRLLAVLHVDDGDGAFDPTVDAPARERDDDDDDDEIEDDRFTLTVG